MYCIRQHALEFQITFDYNADAHPKTLQIQVLSHTIAGEAISTTIYPKDHTNAEHMIRQEAMTPDIEWAYQTPPIPINTAYPQITDYAPTLEKAIETVCSKIHLHIENINHLDELNNRRKGYHDLNTQEALRQVNLFIKNATPTP